LLALVATAAFGVGYGMVVPPTNLSAAEAGGAGTVSLLNFAWCIGAVACSPLVLLAFRNHLLSAFLWIVAFGAFVLAVCFLFVSFPEAHARPDAASRSTPARAPALGTTIAVSVLFFIYVGTETSIGGWAAEDAKRLAGHATSLTTMAPLFFYAGLMLGRGVAPLLLKRIGEIRVVLVALCLVMLGIGVILAARSPETAVPGFAIAGLGCASIYPIYIAWFSKWYGAAARRLGGVVFSTASLGAAAMPWLVGLISTRTGSLRVGLLVPLIGCISMFGLLAILRRRGLALR
jgi:FHS family glucose/mannose:H+ symporter-like MFS transporter